MDLLDRYLQSVRFLLPRREQDDIVRELAENLQSQFDDREEALGRPLREDEQVEILRGHGHPIVVAGRYRRPRHLVGPLLFPIYTFALKLGLGAALLVTVILAVIGSFVHGDPVRQAVSAMLAFPGRGLMVFAWTTLVFAVLDVMRDRLALPGAWDPRSLPRVVRHEDRLSRGHAFTELFFTLLAIVWLALVPFEPFLLLGPAAALFDPAPILRQLYPAIVILTVGAAGLSGTNLLRPYWTPTRGVVNIVLMAASLAVMGVLAADGSFVVPRAGATLPNGVSVDGIAAIINRSVIIGFVVAAAIKLFEIAREVHHLRARRRAPAGAGPASTETARQP